jgi:Periplasmic binding protein
LKTLSVQASPGVGEDKVHFATVIQPDVDPAQRQALIDVLQTFMRDRNLGQRTEVRREQAGQVRLGRTYREWVLHVWDLSGDSSTWARQLEDHNARQPVFALVSGLGHQSWRPIHDFSERFEVPGILPQTDVPVLADHDVYTVYLSKGMTLEAQALAQFLRDAGERGPVMQIYRRDDASTAGAEAFRKAWVASDAGGALTDRLLDGAVDAAFWQTLARQAAGATLVLWLSPQDLAQAQALAAAGSPVKAIYLSSSLNPGRRSGLAADGTGRVRLIYPQELPALREARLDVVRRWLRSNGIAPVDEKVQMNAYLAATVTGMLLSHSQDTYSREFLLERMEHRLGTANELSIYPHMSLGPGQRYASKGSYIVDVGGEDDRRLKPVSDWIVP